VRLSLPLVYAATLGTMAGYGAFLGYGHRWFELDRQGTSRPAQVIFFLSLGTAGLLTGQMVRQARRLAQPGEPRRFCPSCKEPLSDPGEREDGGAAIPSAGGRRANVAAGVGLVSLGVLFGIALFWPASYANLDPDALVGLTFGLLLLLATGTVLQLRGNDLSAGIDGGGVGGTAHMGLALILVFAMMIALAIAVLKTFF